MKIYALYKIIQNKKAFEFIKDIETTDNQYKIIKFLTDGLILAENYLGEWSSLFYRESEIKKDTFEIENRKIIEKLLGDK